MATARARWWDDVVSTDIAHYYNSQANAELAAEKAAQGRTSRRGRRGSLIWGDRVRVLQKLTAKNIAKISARGQDNHEEEMWVVLDDLGGEPLLELYVIDVGQGDGLLLVTPEGHHIMVDGGNIRRNQTSGKNATDFVDWKFSRDYLSFPDRFDPDNRVIQLDAVIASHCDQDHFGGLLDLLDLEDEKNRAELRCTDVRVDALFHAGLSWWVRKRIRNGREVNDRTLGPTEQGQYTKLLGGRTHAVEVTRNLDDPDEETLSGSWGQFIRAVTKTKRASEPNRFTAIDRLSNETGDWLPGFEDSQVNLRVLGPIETVVNGDPALERFPDGDSKNTNGHSVVLRVDYGDRSMLLTGDLNTHSQTQIMAHYGADFDREFRCDVAKGCHHGSHDVSYAFLDGMRPLATIISSGDAETHDHPRATIVAASALTGRKLVEDDSLVAPLIYMTEVARSLSIGDLDKMGEFHEAQPKYSKERPTGVRKYYDTPEEMNKYRLYIGSSPSNPFDWPRLDTAKLVRGIRYGLINVRTDGKRLFFAQMEESGDDWAIATLNEDQIQASR